MLDIKTKHTEIMRLEDRQKLLTSKIKIQKDKGYTPQASKAAIKREADNNETRMFRLGREVTELGDAKE